MAIIDLTRLSGFSTQLWTKIKNNFYPHTTNVISDANEFKEAGIARTGINATNLPNGVVNTLGVIQCLKENDGIAIQLWYSTHENRGGDIWVRNIFINTWGEWKKIADSKEISNTMINARYDNPSDSIIFEKKDGTTVNIDVSNLARLTKDNIFSGTNAFTGDVLIVTNNIFVHSSEGSNLQTSAFSAGRFSGKRLTSSHSKGNDGYVEYVRVKIIDSKNVGDRITGVHLVEIEKKATKTEDVVTEHLVTNGSFWIEYNEEYGNHINIPVRKQYERETYFAIGNSSNQKVFKEASHHSTMVPEIVFTTIADMPQAGGTIPDSNMAWFVQYGLVSKDTNIRTFMEDTPRKDWSNFDYVTRNSDNKVLIDGSEVLTSFNNSGTGLTSTTIDEAIKELKTLVGSGSNGVSRTEFEEHVRNNEQQHQTINSSISTNTQNINETKERVGNLESSVARANSRNTFTSKNVFTNRSPIVDKYFPIKSLSKDGLEQLHAGATYCCTPKEGLTGGQFISALLVPIHNSQPGDTIEATYFVVNADNSRVVVAAPNFSRHTVQDIEYKGHYCIVLNVNNSFNHAVAFGFGVRDTYAGGRRIGLLKQDLSHQGGNNFVWSDYNSPSVGSTLTVTGKFMIPYVITYKTNSEVVTRYDLANNTVPTNNYRVGELKMLVYDAGESIEIGGHTWLRCDGQTVSSGDYSELYETVGCRFNTTGETTIRPANEDGTEVSIDFNLPTNQNVGYLYICAK